MHAPQSETLCVDCVVWLDEKIADRYATGNAVATVILCPCCGRCQHRCKEQK